MPWLRLDAGMLVIAGGTEYADAAMRTAPLIGILPGEPTTDRRLRLDPPTFM
jgi:hypothetical protein